MSCLLSQDRAAARLAVIHGSGGLYCSFGDLIFSLKQACDQLQATIPWGGSSGALRDADASAFCESFARKRKITDGLPLSPK